ncbi:hypothetical protein MRB53_024012 [Persea americana]|uniref:Uncharacterized protein n=1 Tax=Persea americana TaxID=3435 RepID=A0ACC2LCC7_PERAE|nr:hypothetical protein MRB53_024012 [Persea americana]
MSNGLLNVGTWYGMESQDVLGLRSQARPAIWHEEDDDYPALIAGHNGGSPSRHGSNQINGIMRQIAGQLFS